MASQDRSASDWEDARKRSRTIAHAHENVVLLVMQLRAGCNVIRRRPSSPTEGG